ncbi:MAG: MoaD/ThiS family protein [Methanoregulaceae archaeon]|nr:MoaD/ThiS family protein [Methanoregulaceae archaeon]
MHPLSPSAGSALVSTVTFISHPGRDTREPMQVTLPDRSTRTLPGDPRTIGSLLSELGIRPSGVIVARNGVLVPEDAVAGGDDEVRIIRVAHGG